MSGILDSKSRVLDTIITTEGRRQLAMGGIDIKYLTFTDGGTFYKADVASGSQDATTRIYLESCQLPQDNVTFQADDSGNVQSFANGSGLQTAGGQILEYSFQALTASQIGGSTQGVTSLTGSTFSGMAHQLLGTAAENFSNLYLIATQNAMFEDGAFAAGPNQVEFTVTNSRPISDPSAWTANLNSLESVYSDPRFSNLLNFKYLPPVNKVSDKSLDLTNPSSVSDRYLGYYVPWGITRFFRFDEILYELFYYQQLGCMQTINFDPTSNAGNLIGQMFEVSNSGVKKLDVIDYGVQTSPGGGTAHAFFVGKVVVDDNGTDTFLHIFTLIFE